MEIGQNLLSVSVVINEQIKIILNNFYYTSLYII